MPSIKGQILSLFEIVRGVDWDILVSRRGRLGCPSEQAV